MGGDTMKFKPIEIDGEMELKVIGIGILATFCLLILLSSCYVIDQTEVGVIKTLGKVSDEPVYPGLHFKIPAIQSVITMPTTVQVLDMTQKNGHSIKALTSEGLPVIIDVTLQYHIDPEKAPQIYSEFKDPKAWIYSTTRAKVRDIIAQYKAEQLYSDKRVEAQQKIMTDVSETLAKKGIIVDALLIRNVELPHQVVDAIEQKLKAQQEAEKMKFEVQKAKLEAQKKIVEANATAEANRILAESIRQNPEVLEYKKLEILEKMAENNNKVFVVPSSDSLILNLEK
jgi:regulator of protease activity HflC (stomatin/prohibitin superfamily)